ncbi:unnamed protein product [Rhizophagus irregularis]|nr:unnamed protein product [Rhizophagus irregularis]
MPTEKPFRHRAGSLKQSNKPFKSKHATKGTIRDKTKGTPSGPRIRRSGRLEKGRTPSGPGIWRNCRAPSGPGIRRNCRAPSGPGIRTPFRPGIWQTGRLKREMLPDYLDEPGLWNIIGHLGEQNSGGDWRVYFKEM